MPSPIRTDLWRFSTEEHHRRLTFVFFIDIIFASLVFLQFFVLWLRRIFADNACRYRQSEFWELLHDSPIHVQSNTLSAGWADHHTDFSYYSLLLRWIGGSVWLLLLPLFLRSHHRHRNNDFMLVVSTILHGATILVSGVEEIDMSPEDPIVHLSPPYLDVESRGEIPC